MWVSMAVPDISPSPCAEGKGARTDSLRICSRSGIVIITKASVDEFEAIFSAQSHRALPSIYRAELYPKIR